METLDPWVEKVKGVEKVKEFLWKTAPVNANTRLRINILPQACSHASREADAAAETACAASNT